MSQSDAQLVERTLRGDRSAFASLVERYRGLVHGLAFHKLRDLCLAEDVAQEAFVLAYVRLGQLRDRGKFGGWLRTVTLNAVKMKLRDIRRSGLSLDAYFADADDDRQLPGRRLRAELMKHSPPTPHEDLERKEFRQVVMRAIESLSEKNRLVVSLYYLDGMSCRDVGNFLEVPESTVKSRLHEARKQLREELMHMVEDTLQRNRLGPEFQEAALSNVPLWRVDLGGMSNSNIVPAKGRIYVGSGSQTLFCIDAKTGDVIWRFNTGKEPSPNTGPDVGAVCATDGQTVYTGSYQGHRIFALDAATGQELWLAALEPHLSSSFLLHGNTLLFYANPYAEAGLCAFDLPERRVRWHLPVRVMFCHQTPHLAALDDRSVYVVTRDGSAAALDLATGAERWTVRLEPTAGSVYLDDEVLYVAAGSELCAVEAATGVVKWQRRFPAGTGWVGGEKGSPSALLTLADGRVIGLERQTGETMWETTTPLAYGIGSVADGKICISSAIGQSRSPARYSGEVYALDVHTGSVAWRFMTGECTNQGPAVADERCYATSGSWLYALQITQTEPRTRAAEQEFRRLTRSKPDEEDNARLEGLILEKMPGNPSAWQQLAARHEEVGNLHNAFGTWQKCIDLAAPGSAEWKDALRWLGDRVGLRWAHKPMATDAGVAVAAPAGLAVTSEPQHVLAVNRDTGEEEWRRPVRGPAMCACEFKGAVCCAVHGQGITSYRLCDGAERWAFDMREGRFLLTAARDRVFAAGASVPDDGVFCLDPDTGQTVWEYRPSLDGCGWVRHPPIVVDDRVFLQTATAGMYALEADTGREIWKRESVGEDWHSYACLYHDGMLYAGTNDGIAHCVDASTGQLAWQQGLGERLRPCYVTPGGLVLYTCRKKRGLFAFDAKTGERKWYSELPKPWGATPYEDTVIVDSWDGHLFSVEAETGDVKWCLDLQPPPTIRAIDDATLYVSAGVLLYAFDVERLDRAGRDGDGAFGAH